jgi:ATP-dependent helicase/nuclease subunit A
MSIVPQEVIDRQHAASDPATSAWVSANAGTGKTHVLAQRVIRLLLNGNPPEKILCLTFTKAAAANMANRIFETLRAWIALDDAALDKAIGATGAKAGGQKQRERARRLFAAALETPGGLKVQTIHGFCTRLLQQFPFEANVPARFRVLEDVEQKQMLEQLRRTALFEASGNPDSATGRALAAIIPAASDYAFQDGLLEAIRERERLIAWVEHAGGIERIGEQLSQTLGIDPADTLEAVESEILDGPHLPTGAWLGVEGVCRTGSANDKKQAERLQTAIATAGRTRIDAYLDIFFTGEGELRSSIVTASLARNNPSVGRLFDSEKDRLPALCERRKAVLIRDRTVALITLAMQVIANYRNEKNRRGLLDYDDLIARTRDMLATIHPSWVHYKLDLGIDHLLVDEAQDTSPEQWEIIKKFVEEFTAGAGARSHIRRTIFAVGDDKQSIFSFQGAQPLEFDEARKCFAQRHEGIDLAFQVVKSIHSFRSVPIVLDAVDQVFKRPLAHAGLTADPVGTVHAAVRSASPGVVELWPLVMPEDKEEPEPWDQPFDRGTETSPRVKLAQQIARTIKIWLERGDLVGDGDKRHPLRPGDILILVRQRGPLFEAVIRALKTGGIAVAGADRLLLTEHIAIMDLLALADALLHPQDDLALATILKSPLFGLSEEDLLHLAHGRKSSLRAALRTQIPDIGNKIDALDADSKQQSPFGFYARLLGSGGRQKFLSRLGVEANDALDEFLNLALAYETRETPSLQGFVHWLRTASTEVKRDMEIARDEVRVMTVHGAKGLEAPVVILADTTTEPAGPQMHHPKLFSLPAQAAVPGTPDRIAWMPKKEDETAVVEKARATMIHESENEYRRLLYVAMTRAADRLIVCGSVGKNKKMPPGCWYDLIEQGLQATDQLTEEPGDLEEMTVRRYRKSAPETGALPAAPAAKPSGLPDWLNQPAPAEAAPKRWLRPSGTGDEDRRTFTERANERRSAMARGTHVHRLLQSLPDVPVAVRAETTRSYLARQSTLSDKDRAEIARLVLRLLADLQFDRLFLPGSRAEVSIVGHHKGDPVSGQVDRLLVTPDEVKIVDYKTNRPAPKSLAEARSKHPDYVRQLALYRAVLAKLYPGRRVRAALLWTDTTNLMEVPGEDLDAALDILTSP